MTTRKVESKTVTMPPDMARSWLEKYASDIQRPISMTHAKFLAETMRRGTFKPGTAIELSLFEEEVILTDGQHRLMAVQMSGIPQQFVVIIREYSDREKIAEDYIKTDKGKRRTIREDYKTLDLVNEFDLPQSVVDNLGASTAFIRSGFRGVSYKGFHPEDRLAEMRDYAEACRGYYSTVDACSPVIRNRLLRAATMSVAIVTFRYSVKKFGYSAVHDFWVGVALDSGLEHRDPRKTAHEHILITRMAAGQDQVAKGSARATPSYSARYLANCFNAYVKGEKLLYSKVFDHLKPIVILGTPYDGNQHNG